MRGWAEDIGCAPRSSAGMAAIWGLRLADLPADHAHHRASGGRPLSGAATAVEDQHPVQVSVVLRISGAVMRGAGGAIPDGVAQSGPHDFAARVGRRRALDSGDDAARSPPMRNSASSNPTASNKGHTCQVGLWRYSRHPNYFFEWLIWMAFALFALASRGGYWGLISPALILYFVSRVTGIPATEAQAIRSRGEEYRRYQQTTSAFVPWFPKQFRGEDIMQASTISSARTEHSEPRRPGTNRWWSAILCPIGFCEPGSGVLLRSASATKIKAIRNGSRLT